MRIWDLPIEKLCGRHLLGEHHELHCIWGILAHNHHSRYNSHPEVRRWIGKLPALRNRHNQQVEEMLRRGYEHNSPLRESPDSLTDTGSDVQDVLRQSVEEQVEIIKLKGCKCTL